MEIFHEEGNEDVEVFDVDRQIEENRSIEHSNQQKIRTKAKSFVEELFSLSNLLREKREEVQKQSQLVDV